MQAMLVESASPDLGDGLRMVRKKVGDIVW